MRAGGRARPSRVAIPPAAGAIASGPGPSRGSTVAAPLPGGPRETAGQRPRAGTGIYTTDIAPSHPIVGDPPRTRGRPPSLTEGGIVTAALRLTREVGLDNLSMRALARELGAPTMTIYHYVPNKEALRRLVMNHVLREIPIPGPEEGTWDERLRRLEREARRVFKDHPGVSAQLVDGGSEEATRLAEGVLDILRDGGFSSEAAVLCFTTVYTFMTGQIDLDAMTAAIVSGSPTTTLDGVTGSARYSRDELFEFGFDVVIEGLKVKLLRP
jgi:TetR/AcrR family transcriptional regulator, tetracycline repressor protein